MTRLCCAGEVSQVAVSSAESWRTVAGIGAWRAVVTSGSVFTGLVAGAVVQVLVAEEASPALVTDTLVLPELSQLAGPVFAAQLAFVAVFTLPSFLASDKQRNM